MFDVAQVGIIEVVEYLQTTPKPESLVFKAQEALERAFRPESWERASGDR
jgi:hypothetical protein